MLVVPHQFLKCVDVAAVHSSIDCSVALAAVALEVVRQQLWQRSVRHGDDVRTVIRDRQGWVWRSALCARAPDHIGARRVRGGAVHAAHVSII